MSDITLNRPKALWESKNPVLNNGQFGFEEETGKVKQGDGVKHWKDLPFLNVSPYTLPKSVGASPASSTAAAALGARAFGRTSGQLKTARIDKAPPGGGSTNQALTAWASTPLTLGGLFEATGLDLSTPNGIKIPKGGAGKYRLTARVAFSGGTSGTRNAGIMVNGITVADNFYVGTTGAVQVVGENVWLKEGDVVTLGAYCEVASVVAVGDYPLKTWLAVSAMSPVPTKAQNIGNSGPAIDGLPPLSVMGDWSWRSVWAEVANMDAMFFAGNQSTEWLQKNPNGLYNIGTALIPDARPQGEWAGYLDEVISGARDQVFRDQGKNLAKYGTSNMVIRPMWEPNQFNTSQLDPAKYKAAFNRAVPLIRAAFAAEAPQKKLRVAYCYLDAGGATNRDYYPGDANVDIIDMDLYSRIWRGTKPTMAELLDATRLRLEELARFGAERGKKIGISEWGLTALPPGGGTTDWGLGDVPEWIDLVFDWIEQQNPEYAIYFNITDGAGMGLDTTPLAKARYIERAKLLTV